MSTLTNVLTKYDDDNHKTVCFFVAVQKVRYLMPLFLSYFDPLGKYGTCFFLSTKSSCIVDGNEVLPSVLMLCHFLSTVPVFHIYRYANY